MGEAAVALEEVYSGYPYKHLVVGHLAHAEEEIRELSPELAKLIRAHRIQIQTDDFNTYKIPFEPIDAFIDVIRYLPEHVDPNTEEPVADPIPEIPDECYEGLGKMADGSWELFDGDQR